MADRADEANSAQNRSVGTGAGVNDTPTTRQLERVLTLLGYDLGYEDQEAHAMRYLAEFAQRHGTLATSSVVLVARQFAPLPTAHEHIKDVGIRTEAPGVRETETLDEEDTLFALAMLGVLRPSEAPSLLLPYLTSPRAQERWLAAFGLAALHDERALPAIERMLVEFVGPHQPKWVYMFQLWRRWLLRLLAEWGDPRVVPFIRAGLVATVRAEEVAAVPEPQGPEQVFVVESTGKRYTGQEAWKEFHQEVSEWTEVEHQLVYALGRFGAFGALVGVPTHPGVYYQVTTWKWTDDRQFQRVVGVSESHPGALCGNIWRVHACFGALEAQFSRQSEWTYTFASVPALAQAIERLLEGQFGLEAVARRHALEDYDQAGYVSPTMMHYQWVARQAQRDAEDEQATATPKTPSAGEDPGRRG